MAPDAERARWRLCPDTPSHHRSVFWEMPQSLARSAQLWGRLTAQLWFVSESDQMITTDIKRPRNIDATRAVAILYGDWGTSKAYVIGLAFAVGGSRFG